MKYVIDVLETGQFVLTKDGEIVLITNYKARLLDIVEDFITHNGHSPLLTPKESELVKFFEKE